METEIGGSRRRPVRKGEPGLRIVEGGGCSPQVGDNVRKFVSEIRQLFLGTKLFLFGTSFKYSWILIILFEDLLTFQTKILNIGGYRNN